MIGKPSHRAIDGKNKARVLKVYGKTYADFGPTLASEKLSEREGISISDETLRSCKPGSTILSVGSGRTGSGIRASASVGS